MFQKLQMHIYIHIILFFVKYYLQSILLQVLRARCMHQVNDRRCNCEHAYKHCCGHYVQVRGKWGAWSSVLAAL